jgi:CheY-like chemotaxis protein
MSHELRTPLNAILGFSNLLRESGVTREQSEHVSIINRSGEHLLTLIDDVLDLAKIEAGKQSLAAAPCDLISLVSDVVEMIRVRAHAKNLELVWVPSPDYPRYVRTDAPKLRQVLVNLLGNAVKFTEVGRVTLRTGTTAAVDGGLRLRFDVEDTGAGIAAEDQMRVFQPFVQASQGGVQKGTGLGLTITRQFVELMGGTIGLESAPGQGSKFSVEIPAEAAEESEVPVPQEGRESCPVLEEGQPEWRVLVVDDNVENTTVLEQMLRSAGFQVRVAQNGALGVEQFQQWRPHFIWMDIRMPVMDGMEATRRIRELDGGRDVRIAAVTASAFKGERDTVMSAGMDDFIRKPYRWNEIFDCMSRHLGVRYVREPAVAATADEVDCLLRPEALAALPAGLRRELLDAVLSLDARRIAPVVDRVRELDAPLASSLGWFADRFNYTAILNAIERSDQADEPQPNPKVT